jgi:glycosidase
MGDDDEIETSLAQGRFIVHARGIRDHTFHEVQVDHVGAEYDKAGRGFTRRGNFADVEAKIDDLKSQGVSALYLMGTLERDNGAFLNKYSERTEYRYEDTSPLAVTTRSAANAMLGGNDALASLVDKAKRRHMKVIVDSLARVSSSRHHRKYRGLLLHHLSEEGRRTICYGTDGQA